MCGGPTGPALEETVGKHKDVRTLCTPALPHLRLPSADRSAASLRAPEMGFRGPGRRNHSLHAVEVSFLVICLPGFVWEMHFGGGQAGGMR